MLSRFRPSFAIRAPLIASFESKNAKHRAKVFLDKHEMKEGHKKYRTIVTDFVCIGEKTCLCRSAYSININVDS